MQNRDNGCDHVPQIQKLLSFYIMKWSVFDSFKFQFSLALWPLWSFCTKSHDHRRVLSTLREVNPKLLRCTLLLGQTLSVHSYPGHCQAGSMGTGSKAFIYIILFTVNMKSPPSFTHAPPVLMRPVRHVPQVWKKVTVQSALQWHDYIFCLCQVYTLTSQL